MLPWILIVCGCILFANALDSQDGLSLTVLLGSGLILLCWGCSLLNDYNVKMDDITAQCHDESKGNYRELNECIKYFKEVK